MPGGSRRGRLRRRGDAVRRPTVALAVRSMPSPRRQADALAARPSWTVPCRAAADPAPWTSDDPEDAEWAAEECLACPVFSLCEAFALATRAEGVVLAGRRWSPRTANNLRTRGTKTSPATAEDYREDDIA